MVRFLYLFIIIIIAFSSYAFAAPGNDELQVNDGETNDEIKDESGLADANDEIKDEPKDENAFDSDSTSFLAIKLFFSLIIVLVLIYLFFWLIKKKSNFSDSRLYNHLGGLPLGQNKSIQIVEIGNKIYILGVGEDVQAVDILDSNEDRDAIRDSLNIYGNVNNRFNGWIKGKFSKKNNVSREGQFEKELAEKIEQIKEKRSQSFTSWLDGDEKGKS